LVVVRLDRVDAPISSVVARSVLQAHAVPSPNKGRRRRCRTPPAAARFHDDAHLLHVIDRILAPLGRRVDEVSPMVDARLLTVPA
jgi:Flp pilus assembly CpaF family ATPase